MASIRIVARTGAATQYTIIGSAIVPTLMAQTSFQPAFKPLAYGAEVMEAEAAAGEEP